MYSVPHYYKTLFVWFVRAGLLYVATEATCRRSHGATEAPYPGSNIEILAPPIQMYKPDGFTGHASGFSADA